MKRNVIKEVQHLAISKRNDQYIYNENNQIIYAGAAIINCIFMNGHGC